MLEMDAGNRQTQHGTQMKFKLREVNGMAQRHHTCVVWTW